MENINFKELGKFGKDLQVLQYKKIYSIKDIIINNKPEIVFWGKSNVGKSSLINTLLNYKINKVSKKPGCTRWIGFLELKNCNIIDLPGYSFANVSKGRKVFFDKLFIEYIKTKRTSHLFLLIDKTKTISDIDLEIAKLFDFCNISLIYTKCEKSNKYLDELQVSTKTGIGINELRDIIVNTLCK